MGLKFHRRRLRIEHRIDILLPLFSCSSVAYEAWKNFILSTRLDTFLFSLLLIILHHLMLLRSVSFLYCDIKISARKLDLLRPPPSQARIEVDLVLSM